MNAGCPVCRRDLRSDLEAARGGHAFIGPVRFCDEQCADAWRYHRGTLEDRRRSNRRCGERRGDRIAVAGERRSRWNEDRRMADRRVRVVA